MAFARFLLAQQAVGGVGLVPCAVGETSVADWAPGGRLWTRTVERTQQALAHVKGTHLAGLLW
jgi:hypothetical protein